MSFNLKHNDQSADDAIGENFGRIIKFGTGSLGGKASGLAKVQKEILGKLDFSKFPNLEINIPDMIVIQTDVFDHFLDRNNLR